MALDAAHPVPDTGCVRRALTRAELGQRIKSARIACGYMSHGDLRRALGPDANGAMVAKSTISKWENGRARPEELLFRLADVLRVPVEYLLFADETIDHRAQVAETLSHAGIDPQAAAPVLERLAHLSAEEVRAILGAFQAPVMEQAEPATVPPPRQRRETPVPYSGVHSLAPPPVPERVPAKRRRSS
jgi:transcriptional regulator with XRE-family HTH domain